MAFFKHRKKVFFGLLIILLAIGIRLIYPEAYITPFLAGGLFGGGFVLLFGIGKKEKNNPKK